MEKQRRYELLRAELASFQTEFKSLTVELFCERILDWECVSTEGWRAFAQANLSDATPERWVSLPDGEGCLRFHGDVAAFETFRRVASSAWLVLATIEQQFPELHIELAKSGHEFGWLDRIFHTAEAVASSRLHIEGDWWDWAADESPAVSFENTEVGLFAGEGEARYPRHPMVQRLPINVFQASSEAIRVWMNPASISSVGERIDDLAICLDAVLDATHCRKPLVTGSMDENKPDELRTPGECDSPYFTVEEAAGYCRLAIGTIYNHRREIQRMPGTGKLLFRREDLDSWLASRRRRR